MERTGIKGSKLRRLVPSILYDPCKNKFPILKNQLFNDRSSDDSVIQHQMIPEALGWRSGHEISYKPMIDQAIKLLPMLPSSSGSAAHSSFRSLMLCNGVRCFFYPISIKCTHPVDKSYTFYRYLKAFFDKTT